MMPNTLTISAFGPYSKKITIDFEVFKQKGLFLITGPTGSGKTMIFDAIMFALYGRSSGNERETDSFRCDSANNDDATYVEYSFTIHHQQFLIKRSPKYYLEGKKTPKMPTAYLTLPDGQIVEGVKEVNSKIIDILGVDANQFKQVAMIAQGEFTKLILASSDEREKVLRDLFNTGLFKKLEETLVERTKEYKVKYETLFNRKKELENNFDDENYDQLVVDLSKELDKTTKQYQQVNQKHQNKLQELNRHQINNNRINKLNELMIGYHQLKEQEHVFISLEKEISLLKQAKDIFNLDTNQQKSLNALNEVKKSLSNNKIELEQVTNSFNNAEKEYLKINEYNKNKDTLNNDINKLDTIIEQVIKYQNDIVEHRKYNDILVNNKQLLEELNEKKAKIENRLNNDLQTVNEEATLKVEFDLAQQKYAAINNRKVKIHQLADQYDSLNNEIDQRSDIQEEYLKIEKQLLDEKKKYDDFLVNYRHNQAGILASLLKDNDPCPVCGSLEHPNLATPTGKLISSDALDRQQKLVDDLNDRCSDCYQRLMLKNQLLETKQNQLDELSKELEIEEEIDKNIIIKHLSQTNQQQAEIVKSYQNYDNRLKYIEKLKLSVLNTQNDLKELNEKIQSLTSSINENQILINKIEGRLNKDYSAYKIIDLKRNREEIQKNIKSIQTKIDIITKEYQDINNQLITLKTNNESLSNQQQQNEDEYLSLNKSYLDTVKKVFGEESQYHHYRRMILDLDEKESKLHDYQMKMNTTTHQIEDLKQEVGQLHLVDVTSLQKDIEETEQKLLQVQGILDQQKLNLSLKENIIKEIKSINETLSNDGQQYQYYLDLSSLASGKNSNRISFERYVLAAYFENIILQANFIMKQLSQGRYHMMRRDYTSKGRAQQGLELDVLDLESGQVRDIKTLSGGESFKAALSLALGLSKMIQGYAGGIELNTLFIDEGFGSLDSQSLDQAINCLIDLQQDNKLIGIISHVSELKERIDSQIIITRENKESKIRII